MSITIRDVAAAAGVSAMAVSKVLHGKGSNVRVSAEKAAVIIRVAKELRYTPNSLARNLRGGKTKNIGLIFEQFGPISGGSGYPAAMLDGITKTAFARGYSITLCPELAAKSSYNVGDGRFDGVIWGKTNVDPAVVDAAKQAGVKIVHLHVPPDLGTHPDGTYVCCDNRQGIRFALEHLISLGHKKIAFGHELASLGNSEAVQREHLFLEICNELGLEADQSNIAIWRYRADDVEHWLQENPSFTAVLLRTEGLAPDVYHGAALAGRSIPSDLSVVGFDSTTFCEQLRPPLTAIQQPIEDITSRAVEILIDLIEGHRTSGEHVIFPCGFDIRSSTARPSSHS